MGKHGTKRTAKATRPKSKPGLPHLDHSKAAILESLRSPESKRGYRHAIEEFIRWYCSEPRLSFSKVVETRFRIALENRGRAGDFSLMWSFVGPGEKQHHFPVTVSRV